MKKMLLRFTLMAGVLVVAAALFTHDSFAAVSPSYHHGNDPFEAVRKSNSGNNQCVYANGLQLSSNDWQDGRYNVNGEPVLPGEMMMNDGWFIWKCWANDKDDSTYLCASEYADNTEKQSQAVCSDVMMWPEKYINRVISQIKGEASPEDPFFGGLVRYKNESSFIDAAQQSNGGNATCSEQYIFVPGRIDCWNSARDKYWSCFQVQITDIYTVDCDEDNWTSEPPDYSDYPNPDDTTPDRYLNGGLEQKCEDKFSLGGLMCKAADFVNKSVEAIINHLILPLLQWRVLV